MLKTENTETYNFDGAFRGMRMPLKSLDKSDSGFVDIGGVTRFEIGKNDLGLAKRLRKAGTDHRKFLRQIFVCMDITAPLFWWKEFDTYKVGTTANSESTMHTIHKRDLTLDDFSIDKLYPYCGELNFMQETLNMLNNLRQKYIDTQDKMYWRALIELLPCSFNQMRTVTLNYETLLNMYHARKNHKLTEWHTFCNTIEELPYFKEICLED